MAQTDNRKQANPALDLPPLDSSILKLPTKSILELKKLIDDQEFWENAEHYNKYVQRTVDIAGAVLKVVGDIPVLNKLDDPVETADAAETFVIEPTIERMVSNCNLAVGSAQRQIQLIESYRNDFTRRADIIRTWQTNPAKPDPALLGLFGGKTPSQKDIQAYLTKLDNGASMLRQWQTIISKAKKLFEIMSDIKFAQNGVLRERNAEVLAEDKYRMARLLEPAFLNEKRITVKGGLHISASTNAILNRMVQVNKGGLDFITDEKQRLLNAVFSDDQKTRNLWLQTRNNKLLTNTPQKRNAIIELKRYQTAEDFLTTQLYGKHGLIQQGQAMVNDPDLSFMDEIKIGELFPSRISRYPPEIKTPTISRLGMPPDMPQPNIQPPALIPGMQVQNAAVYIQAYAKYIKQLRTVQDKQHYQYANEMVCIVGEWLTHYQQHQQRNNWNLDMRMPELIDKFPTIIKANDKWPDKLSDLKRRSDVPPSPADDSTVHTADSSSDTASPDIPALVAGEAGEVDMPEVASAWVGDGQAPYSLVESSGEMDAGEALTYALAEGGDYGVPAVSSIRGGGQMSADYALGMQQQPDLLPGTATDWPEIIFGARRQAPVGRVMAALGEVSAAAERAAEALRALEAAAGTRERAEREAPPAPDADDGRTPPSAPDAAKTTTATEATVTLGELAALGLAVHGRGSIAGALDPLLRRLPADKQGLRGQLSAAATIADSYRTLQSSTTTDPNEGALEGAMSGMSMGGTMADLLGYGGPWGALAGALLGGIFGSSEARKRAEREAQRIREAQLNELRRLNNALAPVSDYFNRGAFGALAASVNYGAGLPADYNWALQSRRGLRG